MWRHRDWCLPLHVGCRLERAGLENEAAWVSTRAVIGVLCRKSYENEGNCLFFTAMRRELSSLMSANDVILPLLWASSPPTVVNSILFEYYRLITASKNRITEEQITPRFATRLASNQIIPSLLSLTFL